MQQSEAREIFGGREDRARSDRTLLIGRQARPIHRVRDDGRRRRRRHAERTARHAKRLEDLVLHEGWQRPAGDRGNRVSEDAVSEIRIEESLARLVDDQAVAADRVGQRRRPP
jgi:hypothetical protein